MGILNVTPDSFSDGGRFTAVDAAVDHARAMVADGAAIIDIGGESTRPGATPVSVATELGRVLPVVEAVVDAVADLGVVVSIDTRRAEVARPAVAAGASIINDVSASLWPVAADTGTGWIAMHMQGEPAGMQTDPTYGDVVGEVLDFLLTRANAARSAGVAECWIDPGFGFGKNAAHNIALVASIERFVDTPFPVVLGVSRKRTVGLISALADRLTAVSTVGSVSTVGTVDLDDLEGVAPVETSDRVDVGLALGAWAMRSGVQIIRTHDVRAHAIAIEELFNQQIETAA